jgi:hypothetical protein
LYSRAARDLTRNIIQPQKLERKGKNLNILRRISEVVPLETFRVRLILSDGQTIERDLEPLLKGPVFARIREDREQFRSLRAEAGTVVWPCGADLCPDVVIWGGLPPDEARDTVLRAE